MRGNNHYFADWQFMYYMLEDQTFFGLADETEFLWNCTAVLLLISLINWMLETSRKTIKKEV